jgi:large subunit ribosomal protein L9
MKIILNADVYNLGEEGDIREVARGYARNYLFPKNLAVNYSKQNLAIFEGRKAAIAKRREEKRNNALSLKEKIDGMEIVIKMNTGNNGKLFGSVTTSMIAEELDKLGIQLEKKKIDIASQAIKMVGTYPVRVKLYENHDAELKLKVVSQNAPDAGDGESSEKAREEKKVPASKAPVEDAPAEDTETEEVGAGEGNSSPKLDKQEEEEKE